MHKWIIRITLVLATIGSAAGATVTFDTIGGANGDPFNSVTQNGLTVSSSTGSWQKGFLVGNPIPSIYTFSANASVTITTGGLFNFLSFDLGTGGASDPSYVYRGFLNNVDILDGFGTPSGNAFVTIHSSNTSLAIDRLEIFTTLTSTSANLDNISIQVVPEPTTIALLGSGLFVLTFLRGRLRDT